MRRLLLLRHAKSDWSSALPDHQRQLNSRGRAAAERMGRHIRDAGLTPQRVLCSPATRATETWHLVQAGLDPSPDAEFIDALYDFSGGPALLAVLRDHGGTAQSLMIVGHNPSMEGLAALLCDGGDPEALEAMYRKYPTAALAVIDLDIDDWRHAQPGSGRLVSFTRPKELPA